MSKKGLLSEPELLSLPLLLLPLLPDVNSGVALDDESSEGGEILVRGGTSRALLWRNTAAASRRWCEADILGRYGLDTSVGDVSGGALPARTGDTETGGRTRAAGD